MAMFENRDRMWFGTEQKMQWIETPQTGADVSPVGFGTEATGLGGGSFVRNSWDSHKVYQFSWGESADLGLASVIQAYAHGTYGRTPIFFQDPMYYGTNVLPRRVSDPSMAAEFEAAPLIRGIWPRLTPTGSNTNNLPVQTAIYDVPAGYDAEEAGDEIPIAVPPGFTAPVGAFYSTTDEDANIYIRNGATRQVLDPLSKNASAIFSHAGLSGFTYLGIQNTTGSTQAISITAMIARLYNPAVIPDLSLQGPWMSGEGHSGCRFVGKPTLVNYNGVNGGQVGLACTLSEVGAWS